MRQWSHHRRERTMPSTYPTEEGYWPIMVIEAKPKEGEELPQPRCRLHNDGIGPLPIFDNRQLARLLGLAFAHLALTAIATEEQLGAEHARGIIAVLVKEAGESAVLAVDGHYAGDVTHTMGDGEDGGPRE